MNGVCYEMKTGQVNEGTNAVVLDRVVCSNVNEVTLLIRSVVLFPDNSNA